MLGVVLQIVVCVAVLSPWVDDAVLAQDEDSVRVCFNATLHLWKGEVEKLRKKRIQLLFNMQKQQQLKLIIDISYT